MKFQIIKEEKVGLINSVLSIRLEGETELERKAIREFTIVDDEGTVANEIISNSLLFEFKGWSVLQIENKNGNVLTVTAARV